MNNYEYIIASLPVLRQDSRDNAGLDTDAVLAEIRAQLSARDTDQLDLLLDGYDPDRLDRAFYVSALKSRSRFVRAWFRFDLDLRNAKTAWLNRSLGRSEQQDCIETEDHEFEEADAAQAALETDDILGRERALDALSWEKSLELTRTDVFDLDWILGFVTRLKTVERWLRLDPQTGRALFRRLVEEIRQPETETTDTK